MTDTPNPSILGWSADGAWSSVELMDGFDPAHSFGPQVAPNYDEESMRGDEDDTVDFLRARAGTGRALELAIGTGRIGLPLAMRGTPVDGIELSADMVDELRAKPGGEDLQVSIGDMSRVRMDATYDLVYLVFNTIGNLLTQDDQVRCFENAAAHLSPTGVFVLECRMPTAQARPGHQFVDVQHVEVDNVAVDVCAYDPVTQVLDKQRVRIDADGIPCRRSACDWPALRSSTSWRASRACTLSSDSAAGAKNRSPRQAGAM